MKYLIASDIHGSAFYCKKLLDAFKEEGADKLVLLGDVLYHGPRNPLPEGYSPKETATMLNEMKDKILCVRGNCDSAVDQMVLEFPILADYAILDMGKNIIFLTHGDKYDPNNPPLLSDGDVLINGHFHTVVCGKKDNFFYFNPGSISLPKDGIRGYLIYENKRFVYKTIEGETKFEFNLE